MNWLYFILGSLSVWRITHLLSNEDGPFNIMYYIRKKAGAGFFGSLLDCFYCLSIWISIPFAVWLGENLKEQILFWISYSGAACLLEKITAVRKENQLPEYFEK